MSTSCFQLLRLLSRFHPLYLILQKILSPVPLKYIKNRTVSYHLHIYFHANHYCLSPGLLQQSPNRILCVHPCLLSQPSLGTAAKTVLFKIHVSALLRTCKAPDTLNEAQRPTRPRMISPIPLTSSPSTFPFSPSSPASVTLLSLPCPELTTIAGPLQLLLPLSGYPYSATHTAGRLNSSLTYLSREAFPHYPFSLLTLPVLLCFIFPTSLFTICHTVYLHVYLILLASQEYNLQEDISVCFVHCCHLSIYNAR